MLKVQCPEPGLAPPLSEPRPAETIPFFRMTTLNSETKTIVTGNGAVKDSLVFAQTSAGTELHATLLRVTRFLAVFEIYSPAALLRSSEVLTGFKIILRDRVVYAGRAVVQNLINAGPMLVCEVALTEESWIDAVSVPAGDLHRDDLRNEFKQFVEEWQKLYLIDPEYKVVIADIQTFLANLRLWLDQVELGIRSAPTGDRIGLEAEIAGNLRESVTEALTNMFERFEVICARLRPDQHPAHRAFGQRQLHPHLLCAPFIHRTYSKPLGYAGDYEMMNMICRNGLEGGSLYAKLTNGYLLDQIGPQAVRNRVGFLLEHMVRETGRMARKGKTATIYSVACGPAREVEHFLAENPLADKAQFRMLDFNEETLRYTTGRLDDIRRKHGRTARIEFVKNSVQSLLKGASKMVSTEPKYDLIYCSGLYDYLNDRICKALNSYLYDRLEPGGLLVVGNFAPNTPVRNFIEHFLEWFLIYRDGRHLETLAPDQAPRENVRISAESTGTNIFMEVRKPG
jgi:extracellular factor (EF) 3-hydroxypalmitic acid methyl ester biosynthesis protein